MRCPLCFGKLDIYIKSKVARCVSCGWIKKTDSTEYRAGKTTHIDDFVS